MEARDVLIESLTQRAADVRRRGRRKRADLSTWGGKVRRAKQPYDIREDAPLPGEKTRCRAVALAFQNFIEYTVQARPRPHSPTHFLRATAAAPGRATPPATKELHVLQETCPFTVRETLRRAGDLERSIVFYRLQETPSGFSSLRHEFQRSTTPNTRLTLLEPFCHKRPATAPWVGRDVLNWQLTSFEAKNPQYVPPSHLFDDADDCDDAAPGGGLAAGLGRANPAKHTATRHGKTTLFPDPCAAAQSVARLALLVDAIGQCPETHQFFAPPDPPPAGPANSQRKDAPEPPRFPHPELASRPFTLDFFLASLRKHHGAPGVDACVVGLSALFEALRKMTSTSGLADADDSHCSSSVYKLAALYLSGVLRGDGEAVFKPVHALFRSRADSEPRVHKLELQVALCGYNPG
ncbi:hypothetical protein DIPPA_20393 [Diplonema papillatum]|nr:hypothetical protein DIPPA_20393 [Diplonema papillatum]